MVSNLLHLIDILDHPHFFLGEICELFNHGLLDQIVLKGLTGILIDVCRLEIPGLEVNLDLPLLLVPGDKTVRNFIDLLVPSIAAHSAQVHIVK